MSENAPTELTRDDIDSLIKNLSECEIKMPACRYCGTTDNIHTLDMLTGVCAKCYGTIDCIEKSIDESWARLNNRGNDDG